MVRSRSHRTARGGRTASGRRVAPTSLRVALVAILSGALVALAGASGGFWMCVPGVMFAASLDDTALGAVYCTVPILVGAVLVARGDKGAMPPLWEAFAVVGLSIAVMHWVRRRLGHERDVMEHAALSDPLTGLANRRMLMSMAEYEIARHRRAEGRFVVVMLDLNGFKRVNDRHGHASAGAEISGHGRPARRRRVLCDRARYRQSQDARGEGQERRRPGDRRSARITHHYRRVLGLPGRWDRH
jgi:predicted signal transduction protein with EAL and GGDEF domain